MNYDKLLLATLSQDAFFLVNKSLVKKIGVIPALTLSLLIDKYKYFKSVNGLDKEGGFYLSAKNTKEQINIVESELKIARSARRSAFEILKKNKLLSITKKGHPARYFYYLNFKNIMEFISSEDDLTPLSEVESNPTSEDDLTPHIIKTNKQKQIIKTERDSSLAQTSFMNLRKRFEDRLSGLGKKYHSNTYRENGAINRFMEDMLEPDYVLELLNKLVEIKNAIGTKRLADQFLLQAAFTISDLYSYRSKIENAYEILKGQFVVAANGKSEAERLKEEGWE